MASGVPRYRRNELAAALWCCRSSKVTCQQASSVQPGASTRDSSPRRSCWATRCSTAGATPVPSAAAAQAAVWFGKTRTRSSGIPRLVSSWPVSLPGSVPDGSTNHSHWRGPPRSRGCPAVTTTSRYLKIGSVASAMPGSSGTAEEIATSASRLAIRTLISLVTATPADTSTEPGNRLENASVSGLTMNSATVEVDTTRSCSGAPCAARTAACASAPSTTICDAVASSREPPGVSVMPTDPRVTSWSPRCTRRADRAWETADSLTPSALAAAVTEPSRATRTNALSCVSVMSRPLCPPAATMMALADPERSRGRQGAGSRSDADIALLNFRQGIGDCDEICIDMQDGQAVVNSGGAHQQVDGPRTAMLSLLSEFVLGVVHPAPAVLGDGCGTAESVELVGQLVTVGRASGREQELHPGRLTGTQRPGSDVVGPGRHDRWGAQQVPQPGGVEQVADQLRAAWRAAFAAS